MAPPSAAQELVPTVINDAVLKTILKQISILQYQKRDFQLRNKEESPCQDDKFTVRDFDNQIHLLTELFLQICSSLSSCVEGLSFNCNPVTVNATTAVSVDIEGTRRVVVEPAEPRGKPSYLSVAKRNLKEVSSPDTPIRISVSTSTAHDLANTIINDLVFKLIVRALKDLREKKATISRLKYVDLFNLLARLMTIICCVLVRRVEGVSLIGCPGSVGDSTSVVFTEGCYVREIMNP